jgi:hypothetical protein
LFPDNQQPLSRLVWILFLALDRALGPKASDEIPTIQDFSLLHLFPAPQTGLLPDSSLPFVLLIIMTVFSVTLAELTTHVIYLDHRTRHQLQELTSLINEHHTSPDHLLTSMKTWTPEDKDAILEPLKAQPLILQDHDI